MEELTQSARERQELAEFTEKLSASAAVGEAQSVASSAALEAQGTSAGSKDPAVVKQAIKLIEKNPHQAFKLVKDLKRKLKTKTIELAKMQVAAESFKKKSRRAIRKLTRRRRAIRKRVTRRRRAIRNLQSSRRPAQCRVQKKCAGLTSFDIRYMSLGVHWASIGASKQDGPPSQLRLPTGFITWLKKQKSVVDAATIPCVSFCQSL